MRNVLPLSALAVSAVLSLASAQMTVRAQSIVVVPVQTAPVPSLQLPAALLELIRAGGTITLVDARGRIVATVDQGGNLKLTAGMTLLNASAVSVKQGATITRYSLAGRVGSGPLLVTIRNDEGRTLVVPLVTAVSNAAERQGGKKGDGKKVNGRKAGQQSGSGQQDEQGGQSQDQNGNSDEHGDAGHPGQGNGRH